MITCAYPACAAEFRTRWPEQRYCSHRCANRARADAIKAEPAPTGYLTIRQVADRYGYGYGGVWSMIDRRRLRSVWRAGKRVVAVADIEAAEWCGMFRKIKGAG